MMLGGGVSGNAQEVLPTLVCPSGQHCAHGGHLPKQLDSAQNSWGVVSSYSVFLDSKGDCPQRQGWVAPSTQAGSKTSPSSGLGRCISRQHSRISFASTHLFPQWGSCCSHLPALDLLVLLHQTGRPIPGPLGGRSQGAQAAAEAHALPVLPCSRPDPHPESRQGRGLVEVHGEHHLRVQAGHQPHPPG